MSFQFFFCCCDVSIKKKILINSEGAEECAGKEGVTTFGIFCKKCSAFFWRKLGKKRLHSIFFLWIYYANFSYHKWASFSIRGWVTITDVNITKNMYLTHKRSDWLSNNKSLMPFWASCFLPRMNMSVILFEYAYACISKAYLSRFPEKANFFKDPSFCSLRLSS